MRVLISAQLRNNVRFVIGICDSYETLLQARDRKVPAHVCIALKYKEI